MKVEKGNRIVSFAKVVDEESAVVPQRSARENSPNIGEDGSEQMILI